MATAVNTGLGTATSNETTTTVTNTDISKVVSDGSGGDVWGSKLTLSDSSIGSVTLSDMGSLALASDIASKGFALGSSAVDAASTSLRSAAHILETKSESDITKFSKPITAALIAGVAVVGLIVFAVYQSFKGKK